MGELFALLLLMFCRGVDVVFSPRRMCVVDVEYKKKSIGKPCTTQQQQQKQQADGGKAKTTYFSM